MIAFPRGASLYLPHLRGSAIDAVGIDYATDVNWAAAELQPHAAVQETLTVLLMTGGQQLETCARGIVDALSGGLIYLILVMVFCPRPQ